MRTISKNAILDNMVILITILVLISTIFSGCIEDIENIDTSMKWFYSFEKNMQGWTKDGVDLDDPPIIWSVERCEELASDGNFSVKLYLENFNDAGKIWFEKTFDVNPNSLYGVTISYNFATADFGDFNLFNLITTVEGDGFDGKDELNYEGDTGHHSDAEGYVWLEKKFEYIVETDENGEIYINIGVWGSWETTRTYYVDEVNISFKELEMVAEYPDISGQWEISYYNWEGNLTSKENVTIIQDRSDVTIQFDLMPSVYGKIIKNNVENPQYPTEFIIRGIDFAGLGIDVIYILNENSMITEMPLCESCNPSEFSKKFQ